MGRAEADGMRAAREAIRAIQVAVGRCATVRGLTASLVLIAMTGCSTVETRRADPPTVEVTSARSLAEVESCLAEGFDHRHVTPQFRPTAGGGTYILSGQGYVAWVIDLHDAGDHRQIVVHAVTSIWGQDKKLIALVQACD